MEHFGDLSDKLKMIRVIEASVTVGRRFLFSRAGLFCSATLSAFVIQILF